MVRLVKNSYVALAVDARSRAFQDSEAEFLRTANCVTKTAAGSVYVVTASGKNLGACSLIPDNKSFQLSLEAMLKKWAALPAADRNPGGVQVGVLGSLDPKRVGEPPRGGLIIRVYNRQLGRTDKGELRYTVPEDYNPTVRSHAALFAQPANDYLWITQAEWQAMMPANPRKGQPVKLPASLGERILHFHLEPARGLAESSNFARVPGTPGQLTLTVEDVSADEVKLRLQGSAKLEVNRGSGVQQGGPVSYQPGLLGHLAYDPAKKVFTRFDVVALGDVVGRPVGENTMGDRPGANPLGIAFELVTQPTAADRLNPRGARDEPERYLGIKKTR